MKSKAEKIVQSKPTTIKIEFANERAAEHFASWLSGGGEQHYWEWMRFREQEESGNITVRQFHYHGKEDTTKAITDPTRYGKFMEDNTIRTTCGRMDNLVELLQDE